MQRTFQDYMNELKIKEMENKILQNEINNIKSLEDVKNVLKKYLSK